MVRCSVPLSNEPYYVLRIVLGTRDTIVNKTSFFLLKSLLHSEFLLGKDSDN